MLNTDKLQLFADDLKNVFNKNTDALFVENLISAIKNHPSACINAVNQWLKSAFELPENSDNDNCIDVYNRSFYHQLREKLN